MWGTMGCSDGTPAAIPSAPHRDTERDPPGDPMDAPQQCCCAPFPPPPKKPLQSSEIMGGRGGVKEPHGEGLPYSTAMGGGCTWGSSIGLLAAVQ